uniref:Uncharacterized protein n=1 Tax=Ditylenchus dipsaci TaxID=166011 RepID=A0A915DGE0_9BILA
MRCCDAMFFDKICCVRCDVAMRYIAASSSLLITSIKASNGNFVQLLNDTCSALYELGSCDCGATNMLCEDPQVTINSMRCLSNLSLVNSCKDTIDMTATDKCSKLLAFVNCSAPIIEENCDSFASQWFFRDMQELIAGLPTKNTCDCKKLREFVALKADPPNASPAFSADSTMLLSLILFVTIIS